MTTEQQPKAETTAGPTTARMIIGGESVDASDGQTFDVVNPATGQVQHSQTRSAGLYAFQALNPGTNVVRVYVGYLRRKLGSQRFETVRGMGYKFSETT